jgi:superfamily I DNA/RNA helicase
MTAAAGGGADLCTYDTLPLARELNPASGKLGDLARHYGIDPGQSHRALDDTRTLARVFLALGEAKVARARKTALVNLLDHLGAALALSDEESLGTEAQLLRRLARAWALGRYSDCLEFYRAERDESGDRSLPTVDDLIERLGGEELMLRLRAEKSAEQRYPAAMSRLRPLLDQDGDRQLAEQIAGFLERALLSKANGVEPERARVNLLTLHATKGLEFSRVYVVGVEDAQLPGSSRSQELTKRELEEARRLLYVGMTRTMERLVLTRVEARGGKPTGGHRFLDEMHLVPRSP